jgi:hypothetical protein
VYTCKKENLHGETYLTDKDYGILIKHLFNRTSPVVTPEILWAQRPNELYLTINVSDVESPKIELTENSLHFVGPSHGKVYEVKLDLLKDIDVDVSEY